MLKFTLARLGSPIFCGLKLKLRLACAVHGAEQLPRAATVPNCRPRHFLAAGAPRSSNVFIAAAVCASAVPAELLTNARSLPKLPSPFTSPEIEGVNRAPDTKARFHETYTTSNTGMPVKPTPN